MRRISNHKKVCFRRVASSISGHLLLAYRSSSRKTESGISAALIRNIGAKRIRKHTVSVSRLTKSQTALKEEPEEVVAELATGRSLKEEVSRISYEQ